MKHALLALLLSLSSLAISQSNISLTIFNNGGQQFFVVMNGIKQNALPKTNVRIGGMMPGSYEVKLIFADGRTPDINKKIWIDENGDYLARVVMKGKKRKLQYFGVTNQDTPLPAGSESINYRADEQTVYSDNTNVPVQSTQTGSSTQSTTPATGTVQTTPPVYTNGTATSSGLPPTSVQSTTTTVTTPTGQSTPATSTVVITADPSYGQGGTNISNTTNGQSTTVGSSVVIPDPNIPTGFGVHINVTDPNGTTTSESTTVTTTGSAGGMTTTTTTSTSSSTSSQVTNGVQTTIPITPVEAATPISPTGTPVPATSANCTVLLQDLDNLMVKIQAEDFENDKKQLVLNELAPKCLSTDQAYRLINAFDFEADRLELAKALYVKLTDRQNGARINELFDFEASRREFNVFMKSH